MCNCKGSAGKEVGEICIVVSMRPPTVQVDQMLTREKASPREKKRCSVDRAEMWRRLWTRPWKASVVQGQSSDYYCAWVRLVWLDPLTREKGRPIDSGKGLPWDQDPHTRQIPFSTMKTVWIRGVAWRCEIGLGWREDEAQNEG